MNRFALPSPAQAKEERPGPAFSPALLLLFFGLFCLGLLGLPQAARAACHSVVPEHLTGDVDGLHMDVLVPHTGVKQVDADLRGVADDLARQGRAGVIPEGAPWHKELFGTYESYRCGNDIWSFLQTFGLFLGGAHPIPVVDARVYDLATGRRLKFGDVFKDDTASVQTLASYVMADLINRQGLDENWVSGAFTDPAAAVSHFLLRENGPIFVFAPYEVAPYVYGTVTVKLPWGALKDLTKPGFPPSALAIAPKKIPPQPVPGLPGTLTCQGASGQWSLTIAGGTARLSGSDGSQTDFVGQGAYLPYQKPPFLFWQGRLKQDDGSLGAPVTATVTFAPCGLGLPGAQPGGQTGGQTGGQPKEADARLVLTLPGGQSLTGCCSRE